MYADTFVYLFIYIYMNQITIFVCDCVAHKINGEPLHLRPNTVGSRYIAVTFLQITREKEAGVVFVRSKCDRSFALEVVVLYVILCYNVPRYIENL